MRTRKQHGLRIFCLAAIAAALGVTPALSADKAKSTNKKGGSKTAVVRKNVIVIQIP
ncbi:MAG: hypothetical protein IID45_08730, partial [Planctomycetes bacterium]|nr:hypothetical protein [Planctomycetota bacterium]